MMNTELMLKELRYLRNRKIVKVRELGFKHICLHFEGGSYCIFAAQGDYDGGGEFEIKSDLRNFDDFELVEMGLMPQEEADERERIADEKEEEASLSRRRAEYKKLKAEFEEDQ